MVPIATMTLTSQARSPLSSACRAGAVLLIGALLATGSLPASAQDPVWIGDDANSSSLFSRSGNWLNNQNPTWSSNKSLLFRDNQKSGVTGLVYDLGWNAVDDIKWETTFPVARTLSSTGDGIDFRVRLENLSSYTQTVTMNLSGGKYGANEIQLNPVKASLILSGTIYNDNSLDYVVWGSDTGSVTNLTLNTELGPNALNKPNVDFTVSGGRTSAIQVNASQSWAGTTTVNSGSFITANGVTLASTAFVLGGGTFATTSANTLADAATLTVNSGRLSIGGSDTVASLAGSGGTVDIASGATLTAGNASSTSYAGSITGSGGFTKVGSGAITLSGNNSYGGALVSQGTLVGNASTSFGSGSIVLGDGNSGTSSIVLMANTTDNTTIANAITVANLGTGLVSIGGTNTGAVSANAWNGTLTLNRNVQVFNDTPHAGGRTSFLGQITGSGGITVTQGRGRVTLQNTTNNFTGPVVVDSGATLQLDVNNGINEVIPNSAAVTVNGLLNFASGGGTETIGSLSGSGTVSSVVAGTYSLVVGGSASTTFSGVINSGSGVIGLTKSGAGTLLLTGSNGLSGGVALNAGTLGVGSANALGSSGTISFGGGTLQYSASNTTDYSGRFSNAASQQYSIDTNGQNVTLGSNLTSSGGSFTKTGGGNLILSGSSTYSGTTSVSAGRLSVNGSLGSTGVTVQSGGELGGSGGIGGTVAVLAGGTLSPGNSIESLAAGATTFAGSSTFEYEYDSTNPGSLAAAADLLVVNGNLTINAGSILTLADLAGSPNPFVNDTTIFALINYSGTWNNGVFTYNGTELADGAWFLVGSQKWEIDYNRTSSTGLDNFTGDYLPASSFVTITAVPEPSASVLLAVGGVAASLGRRLRRRFAGPGGQSA